MRIPLTKYGWPQVAVYPLAIVAAMASYAVFALYFFPDWVRGTPWAILRFWAVEGVLLALLVWALMFFRDPPRRVPSEEALLLAPADGKIADIATVDDASLLEGPALRIGIFLSVFDTHINRAPCRARVEKITYRRGKYLNAMNPLAGKVNESNNLTMVRAEEPADRLVVRQISGAVARRIVCAAREGQQLAGGEPFGMIKFGSRTELYVPAGRSIECMVQVGDKVKAGVTPLARYTICRD
jgi:phosphatidylserine decarboxylase